ncbi:MAG TPA: helix-turn-helix transcriptional regulator [Solirubrobacteraceae bacterium]
MQPRTTRRGRKPDAATQKQLGQNIRTRREQDELTQEDLAAACDLHPTEIGRLERGERDVRLSTLLRVARGLRIAPRDLLDGIR